MGEARGPPAQPEARSRILVMLKAQEEFYQYLPEEVIWPFTSNVKESAKTF
jgi:hypothetical protein